MSPEAAVIDETVVDETDQDQDQDQDQDETEWEASMFGSPKNMNNTKYNTDAKSNE